MAQGVGQDGLVLSHYDEINLRTVRLLLIGLLFIITAIIYGYAVKYSACSDMYHDADTKEAEQECEMWMDYHFGSFLAIIGLFLCGIICIIFWLRSRNIRKSAMVAEASGDYEKAILLVSKLKDHKVIPSLTMKRNAPPQPVQSPQVQQQYAQPQPQPQPATASSPQPSPNPTINVNIQNVQPDTGAKNIHIQDSVVNDSDLL